MCGMPSTPYWSISPPHSLSMLMTVDALAELAPRRTRWGRTPYTPRTSPRRAPRRWGGRRERGVERERRVRATRASGRRRGRGREERHAEGESRARRALPPDAGSSGGEGGAGGGVSGCVGSRSAGAARGARRRGRRGAGPRESGSSRGSVVRSNDARGWTRGLRGGGEREHVEECREGPLDLLALGLRGGTLAKWVVALEEDKQGEGRARVPRFDQLPCVSRRCRFWERSKPRRHGSYRRAP